MDSSVHKIFLHFWTGQALCSLANCILFDTCFLERRGTFLDFFLPNYFRVGVFVLFAHLHLHLTHFLFYSSLKMDSALHTDPTNQFFGHCMWAPAGFYSTSKFYSITYHRFAPKFCTSLYILRSVINLFYQSTLIWTAMLFTSHPSLKYYIKLISNMCRIIFYCSYNLFFKFLCTISF